MRLPQTLSSVHHGSHAVTFKVSGKELPCKKVCHVSGRVRTTDLQASLCKGSAMQYLQYTIIYTANEQHISNYT